MKQRTLDFIKVVLLLGISMAVITYMYHREGIKASPGVTVPPPEDTIPKFSELPASEGLREALIYYEVQHPDIVYAQAVLETGHFKSVGCLKHNNLFGLYNSKAKRYHRFEHWTESVVAYKKWIQRRYKPPADYYAFLKRIGYATDPQYIQKLKIIVKKENDKRRYVEGDTFPQRV